LPLYFLEKRLFVCKNRDAERGVKRVADCVERLRKCGFPTETVVMIAALTGLDVLQEYIEMCEKATRLPPCG